MIVLGLVATVLALGGLLGTPPAQACACGGFAAADGEQVAASSEYAAVAFDGSQQRILLSMNTLSNAKDAALLIPTPGRATAALAEPTLFPELAKLTEPETVVRYRWWPRGSDGQTGGAAPRSAGGATVSVLETRQLGDLEVTSLAASDARALSDWLQQHGYELRAGLADALRPYVAEGWYYTAIRLTTDADDLSGALQPLDLRFASDELVYPMRLSAAAANPQFVRTYVFADHRTIRTDATAEARAGELRFAGRLDASAVTTASLREMVSQRPYLTATDDYFNDPGRQIVSDFTFAKAPTDEPYRQIRYVERTKTILGMTAGPVLMVGAILVANLVVLGALLWRRRAAASSRSTPA